jgi:hypothetical protein
MLKYSADESAFSQIDVLKRQILAAQAAGILLIVVPSLLIDWHLHYYDWLSIVVVAVTGGYFLCVYWDKLRSGPIVSFGERLQRYRSHLGWLIGADAVLCLGLVGLSGGFPDSHLSFVFLLIPCSVGFVRAGGRTLFVTVCAIVVTVISESLLHVPSKWLASLLQLCGVQPIYPYDSPRYGFIVGIGIVIGVWLAWYQSFIASGSSIPDRVMGRIMDLLKRDGIDSAFLDELIRSVHKAYHRISRLVSMTNEPDLHCSVVHPLDDSVAEAFILALPGRNIREKPAISMQAAAEVTLAAHWLDDVFDSLGYERLARGTQSTTPLDISTATTEEIAGYYHPYGIQRVMKRIRDRTRWATGCESGLLRIVCGGLMQNEKGLASKSAAERIRNDAASNIADQHLSAMLQNANAAFLWGITKSDMPLVVAIYWTGNTALYGASLILDALFSPLLIWHDFENELAREMVPRNGFDGRGLKKELSDATNLAINIIALSSNYASHSEVFRALNPVLRLALRLYGPAMPSDVCYTAYRSAVRDWLAKNRQE